MLKNMKMNAINMQLQALIYVCEKGIHLYYFHLRFFASINAMYFFDR